MRDLLNIIDSILTERATAGETGTLSKTDIESALSKAGYTDVKHSGNKLQVLVQIPDGAKKEQYRSAILQEILALLKKQFPAAEPQYSNDATLSSIGGVVFAASPVKVLVKDKGKQGDQSAGVANEIELASIIQSAVEKYGTVDVTFVDPRGVELDITNVDEVEVVGRDTAGRKKADVVLKSSAGDQLPVSIKKVDADMWESADSLFGSRAREILNQLVDDGVVELKKVKERGGKPVYALSKEIVMEPTEQEAMSAIFGGDLNPRGGVVIQTFKPEHFKQEGNQITVECHAVINKKEDIPESHLMVWLLRNDSDRNSAAMGIAGIRPLGVTLTRGIGRKGTKDVVLVDVEGNVIDNPNLKKQIMGKEPEAAAQVDADDLDRATNKTKFVGPGASAASRQEKIKTDPSVLGRRRR
jgi:hypothetical protein